MAKKKVALSKRKREQYQFNADMIKFFRRNPIIACEELLGIQLMDSQKWILQESWNTPNNIWTCSRSFGKSFMVCVIAMLKLLLYPNIQIYLLSSKGSQAQETFIKLENMAKQRINSIPSLKDIFINEVEKSKNSDGFVHDKSSFRVTVLTGGSLFTLNSVPDNIRGKRANLLIFDESSFCTHELIETALPFIAQDSSFVLSTDDDFNSNIIRKPVPNQVIYASSAGDITSRHAQLYKEFSLKMIAGDDKYFSADMPCDVALRPYVNGEKVPPLLTQDTIDSEMARNPDKALREYYNKFQADGGQGQIIKWANIRRNETFELPQLASTSDDEMFMIAFDPARAKDNSIIGVMKVVYDDEKGYIGEIVHVLNLLETESSKQHMKKFTDQTKILRQILVDFSTKSKLDYEGIHAVFVDTGAGGHGTSYADTLLESWTDEQGIKRHGLIDRDSDMYKDEVKNYPDAKNILELINPSAMKKQMVEEMMTMVKSDLIKFPKEHDGKPEMAFEVEHPTGKFRKNEDGKMEEIVEIELKYRPLSEEERISLANIDIMKSETTSIHEVGTTYKLPKDKENMGMNDDRFDVLCMLAHGLYQLRREDTLRKPKKKHSLSEFFIATSGSQE